MRDALSNAWRRDNRFSCVKANPLYSFVMIYRHFLPDAPRFPQPPWGPQEPAITSMAGISVTPQEKPHAPLTREASPRPPSEEGNDFDNGDSDDGQGHADVGDRLGIDEWGDDGGLIREIHPGAGPRQQHHT